ncbi:MAG: AAA family ATPase [Acidobacteriota bacterium]
MSLATSNRRIESVTRKDLARRLREIVQEHFPGSGINRRELSHLVQVVTNEALFLSDLYARVALGEILERHHPELPNSLKALVRRFTSEGKPRLLYEVKRLPERIKVVGDKCLLDVGLIGQRNYQGIPLTSLGPRSYQVAAQILAHLAEDPLLNRFFRENRLANLSIEEEITFLQQCSRRFDLYSRVLHLLGAQDRHEGDQGSTVLVPVSLPSPAVVGASEAAEGGGEEDAEAVLEKATAAAAAPKAGGERLLLSGEELLAAYERILLFSALDQKALGDHLAAKVVGQEPAIRALCDEFALHAAGTQNLNRPPSYLFVGPTGVGKNYLVETLKELLESAWGIEIPLLLLEGPNYTYPSDINELRGATRGFIRSDEAGLLTEFHQRASGSPLSIILVDEVEKAHAQLRKFFLSIMDRGTVTDNRGQVLQFANSMVIYTSNIGYSNLAQRGAPIGYAEQEQMDKRVGQDVDRDLRRTLSPEFMNRLRVVHFNYLNPESIDRIFDLEMARIARRFQEVHNLDLEITPAARREILKLGYSHDHGARHLRSRLETLVNVEVSRKIKSEEKRRQPGSNRVLRYLRGLKTGQRKFDLDEVRSRVMRQARARVPYRTVVVDYRKDRFVYTGVPGSS